MQSVSDWTGVSIIKWEFRETTKRGNTLSTVYCAIGRESKRKRATDARRVTSFFVLRRQREEESLVASNSIAVKG
jgi:hypothetical protein